MNNPVYLSRGGEQVFEPPYVAEGVQFFGFIVKADNTSLQAICDRYLNGPSGSRDFSPLVPFAMFVFNKIEQMYAKSPPDNNRGWYSEQEGAVWMLVWDSKRGKPLWYHPYMVVDSSYAMAMGREIYGFPKEIGWFQVPDGPRVPNTLSVKTVLVKTLTANTQAKPGLLFAASLSKDATSTPPYMEVKDLNALTEAVTQRLVLARYANGDRLKALSLPMPMIFLKQFRDSVDPKRTCFPVNSGGSSSNDPVA